MATSVDFDAPVMAAPDLESLIDSAIKTGETFDAPNVASSSSSSSSSDGAPGDATLPPSGFQYDAPRAKGTRRMGMEVDPKLAELFTPDGIGAIFSHGLNAFYTACEAAPLSDDEDKLIRKMFAFYMQARMPEDAGKYQPELLLFGAIAGSLVPRLPQVAPKTAPFFKRAAAVIWAGVTYPFRKVKNSEGDSE